MVSSCDLVSRTDISTQLIHFTKGNTWDDAFRRLQKIIGEGTTLGSNHLIKGGVPCVCMSEAPVQSLMDGLRNYTGYTRYSPFGIMFDKVWAFSRGGRPAIYEPDAEFELLTESNRWRHVRYEPTMTPAIDFTWEREWRIPVSELNFGSGDAVIVVPSRELADQLVREHDLNQDYEIWQYSQIMDPSVAESYREAFPWDIKVLSE